MAVPWFHTPTPPLIRWHLFLGHLALLCIPALSGFGDTVSGAWVDYPLQKLPLHALRIESLTLEDPFCRIGPVPITIQEVRNGTALPPIGWIRAGTVEPSPALILTRCLRIRFHPKECLEAALPSGTVRIGIPGWREWLPTDTIDLGLSLPPADLAPQTHPSRQQWSRPKHLKILIQAQAPDLPSALFGPSRPHPGTALVILDEETFALRIEVGEPYPLPPHAYPSLLTYSDAFLPRTISQLPTGWRSSHEISLIPIDTHSLSSGSSLEVHGLGAWYPPIHPAQFRVRADRLTLLDLPTDHTFQPTAAGTRWEFQGAESKLDADLHHIAWGPYPWIKGADAPGQTHPLQPATLTIGDRSARLLRQFQGDRWSFHLNDWHAVRHPTDGTVEVSHPREADGWSLARTERPAPTGKRRHRVLVWSAPYSISAH